MKAQKNQNHSDTPVFNLIPEDQLTRELSPVWHKRFDKAVRHILENIQHPLNWQEVANLCAISPNHFRDMFSQVFNETPGQYLRRMRLKLAVYYLCTEQDLSITEIATESGFSSSQALAKVLRQLLNTSASEIRDRIHQHDEAYIEDLMRFSGHPQKGLSDSMEQAMASDIPVTLKYYPERPVFIHKAAMYSFSKLEKIWKQKRPSSANDRVLVYSWTDLASPDQSTTNSAGYFCDEADANHRISAGLYLSCRVNISGLAGYYATLKSLYLYVLRHGLEPENSAPVIETYHNCDTLYAESIDLSASILVRPAS